MELGGLEPPTSWVRCGTLKEVVASVSSLLRAAPEARAEPGSSQRIAGDYRGLVRLSQPAHSNSATVRLLLLTGGAIEFGAKMA